MVRRERPDGRAQRAPDRRPRTEAAPHELLRLQRTAGNAAVTRMLQRKIGFELEAGEWKSAWLDQALTEEIESDGYVSDTVKTKPPPARKAFYEKGIVRGTADELPGTRRDVEFVIKEQDESQLETIGTAFDDVHKAYGAMTDQLAADVWIWPEKRLGWSPPDTETWLLDKDDAGETVVQLQATTGIPLDQLSAMIAHLDKDSKQTDDDPRKETSIHPGAHGGLVDAQSVADAAVEKLVRNVPTDSPFKDTGKLTGFVMLMAQMILGGDPGDAVKPAFSYPKAIATILPRTDFVAMLGTLDPLQKDALAQPMGEGGVSRLVYLVQAICKYGDVGDIDKPVLGWSAWKQIDLGMIVPDLTRRAWAEGIVQGADRLSQTGYLTWLQQRSLLGAVEGAESRKKEAGQLDSLGSYHEKMDTGEKDEKLPLVEFRALANGLSLDMTVPEAKAVGLRLAAHVAKLTQRGVKWL